MDLPGTISPECTRRSPTLERRRRRHRAFRAATSSARTKTHRGTSTGSHTVPRPTRRSIFQARHGPGGGAFGNIVDGYYVDASASYHGFLYDGTAWTTLNDPLAAPGPSGGTFPAAITGNTIVGYYYDNTGASHGFVYNASVHAWTTLPAPAITANGISGNEIVGDAGSVLFPVGYVYDITTGVYSYPLSLSQFPVGTYAFGFNGISGNTIVGIYHYIDVRGGHDTAGFVATIPEPSTMALGILALAGFALLARRMRSRGSPRQ